MELFTDDFVRAVKLAVELPEEMNEEQRGEIVYKLTTLAHYGFHLPDIVYRYGLQDWIFNAQGQFLCFNNSAISVQEEDFGLRKVNFLDFLNNFTFQMLIGYNHCLAIQGNKGFYRLMYQDNPNALTKFFVCNEWGLSITHTHITNKYNMYLKHNRKIGIINLHNLPEGIRKNQWFINVFKLEKAKENIITYNPEDDILTLETE